MQSRILNLSCRIEAHAKINVTLDVLGVRPDGYHDLSSVVMPVALHDDVVVSAIAGGTSAAEPSVIVEVVPEGVDISRLGPPDRNLCVKAAQAYFKAMSATGAHRLPPRLDVRVVKRIPLGGGLGGGSADAAAVLAALDWMAARGAFGAGAKPLGEERLVAVAAEVGSDVPALFLGGATLMEGRGERVRRLPGVFGTFDILLANPGIHVSTPEAFRALDALPRDGEMLTKTRFSDNILTSRNCGKTLPGFAAMLSNGLEKAVFGLHPEIARLAARLRDAGARGVLMSGSGATVFALAASPSEANALAGVLPAGCWSAVSQTVPDGVMAAHGPLEA